jgi:hypothetical protein
MNSRYLVLAVVGTVLVSPAVAEACAVCLTGAQNDPTANAFNWSILFLMAIPYAILGSIGGWFFYDYKRATRKGEGAGKKAPFVSWAWAHKESGR